MSWREWLAFKLLGIEEPKASMRELEELSLSPLAHEPEPPIDEFAVPRSKRDAFMAMLNTGGSAWVYIDPRDADVIIPEWLKDQPSLALEIGLNMPIPITDILSDLCGFRCTLSFRRSPSLVVIPWSVVYAILDSEGEGTMWPSAMPQDADTFVSKGSNTKQKTMAPVAPLAGKRPRPAWMRVIEGGSAANHGTATPPDNHAA